MGDVLANLNSGNLEEVPDADAAIKAGTHGYPLYSPQGEPSISSDPQEASTLMSQGYTQPTTEQLQAGLCHAKVNTTGEKIGSELEGGAEGAGAVYTGVPLVTAAEIGAGKLLNIKELSPEYIALRHKYNAPEEISGNVLGAGAAAYFGGEATLPFTLPKMAEGALAKAFGSQLAPLGSFAAKGMVQGALMSGNQELAKFMYDPSQTVDKAVANLTLNTALSGIGGAAIGSLPALWSKTANAVNTSQLLQSIKNGANVTQSGADITDQITSMGIPATVATKGAVSSNSTIRNLGTELGGADAVRKAAPGQMVEGLGVAPEELQAIQDGGNNSVAAPIRQTLVQNAQQRYNAEAQGWEATKANLAKAIVPPEAAAAHADAVSAFQGQYQKFANTTPEFGIIEQAKKDLPNLETLQDYQGWRSGVLGKIWNSDSSQGSYWNLKNSLDNWEDKFAMTAGGAMDPSTIPALQAQRQSYANTMSYFRNLSTAMKMGAPKGGPNSGPQAWIDHLADPLQVTDQQLLGKTTQVDNDALLDFYKNNIPESGQAMNQAYRYQAIQKSLTNGQVNPQKMWNYIQNNWSPKLQQQVVGDQGLRQMSSTMDLLNSVGNNQARGPGWMQKIMKYFFGGVGAIAGHAVGGPIGGAAGAAIGMIADTAATKTADGARLALLKFLEDGRVDPQAFRTMADYFGNATTAHSVMANAVSKIIDNGSPDSLPQQAQVDPKGANKLDALMQSYQSNQGSMFGIGGNLGTYLPEHQMALGNLAGRAQQYLSQIKPQTDALGPLDSKKVTSQADQAKYDRALNLVNKPLSILSHIAKGNITQDDMAAMELYPSLTKELQQHFMDGIMESKSKGKVIPYQQRLALSQFLGTNLDSTIGPMTMMTLMQSQKPPGGPQGGGRPGKKPPQGAFTKMQEGANSQMTPNQKAEQDRVTSP